MILRVEHIGIAVEGADATDLFNRLLNRTPYKTEPVASESVNTVFYETGGSKIELLESTNDQGPIAKFLNKKGPGIHHIAFEVDDIFSEMERLRHEGFELLNDNPKKGADNKLICFLHPKSTSGVLVELCQEIK